MFVKLSGSKIELEIGLRQSTQTFIPRGLTEPEFRSSSIFDPGSVTEIPKSL